MLNVRFKMGQRHIECLLSLLQCRRPQENIDINQVPFITREQ